MNYEELENREYMEVFNAWCQQGIPVDQFPLLLSNDYEFSINLSGHVADPVGCLT